MADHFLPGLENLNNSFTAPDIHPNSNFTLSPFSLHPPQFNIHGLTGFPPDTLLFPHSLNHSPTGLLNGFQVPPVDTSSTDGRVERKREAGGLNNSSENVLSDNGVKRRKSSGRGKKAKGDEKQEKLSGVVHVRAKRGQATDSHSLAERVRREKINERLRCLQDIVPGCYKTMGMAVMLDEIISYVQSLQNQVEFLSMKLTAASTFYNFNSEADALETIQREKAVEALKIQNGDSPQIHSAAFTPFHTNFGCYPQLPYSR